MKMILTLIGIMFIRPVLCLAQTFMPGGVPGAKIWLASEKMEDGSIGWVDQLSEQGVIGISGENESVEPALLLNFNAAVRLSGRNNGVLIPVLGQDFSRSTYFTVARPNDTLVEQAVWSHEVGGMGRLTLSTHRMADLSSARYMNFVHTRKDIPGINTYVQFKEKDGPAPAAQFLNIGGKPSMPKLPVAPYQGIIPEIIIYGRVLTDQERLQVESYLALKYGLTLSLLELESYLNSKAEVVWDGKKNAAYSFNIAGIGRDDASGLNQKQSSSSYDPDLLAIGINRISPDNASNPSVIEDGAFLIWGDNNGLLALGPKEQGQPRHLQRRWMMSSTGHATDLKTVLQFNTKKAEDKPLPEETWWLTIDHSETGNFPLGMVEYHKLEGLSENRLAIFQDIHWGAGPAGKEVFTFSIAPEMMGKVWISAPSCAPPSDGTLHIGAEGGKPPYRFSLFGIGASFRKEWESNDNAVKNIAGIASGEYELTIRDAANQVFKEMIYVQSSDAPVSTLPAFYELKPDAPLALNALGFTTVDGLSFHWLGPDGYESRLPDIAVTAPGTYRLELEKDGCYSRQDIIIAPYVSDVFEDVVLYPNPASDGRFNLKIKLRRQAEVEIMVSDATGRALFGKKLQGDSRYDFSGRLHINGTYTVLLRSGQASRVFQLVVNSL